METANTASLVGQQLLYLQRLQRLRCGDPDSYRCFDRNGPAWCLDNLDAVVSAIPDHPAPRQLALAAIGRAAQRQPGGWLPPSTSGKIAVVAALFNPVAQADIWTNYHAWRAQLSPLLDNGSISQVVVVEAVWPGQPTHGDILLPADARHVLWQKESLLQRALRELQPDISYVAWFDADVLLLNLGWVASVRRWLSVLPVLQCFNNVLISESATRPPRTFPGIIEKPDADRAKPGYAWIASREFLAAGGFYQHAVVGGADAAMAQAWTKPDRPPTNVLGTPAEQQCWSRWAAKYRHWKGGIGYIAGAIAHLYHGPMSARGYISRSQILKAHKYDPAVDVICEPTGLLAWAGNKPVLQKAVADYFLQRSRP